jgi:hypothetical protein
VKSRFPIFDQPTPNMLLKTLIILIAIAAVFVAIVSFRPSGYRIVRSVTVNASADDVFSQINDLRRYSLWNPWSKADPNMKTSFEGPPAGPGATMKWAGNRQVGEGVLKITESRPGEQVTMELTFIKPFPSTATAEFTITKAGDQTTVTWAMLGEYSFVPKAIGLFVSMDRMIGTEFEKGLAELKQIVEKPRQTARAH